MTTHEKFSFTERNQDCDPKSPWKFSFLMGNLGDEYAIRQALQQVHAWCAEQYGPANPHRGRWRYMGRTIRFRLERDAMTFKMRWL